MSGSGISWAICKSASHSRQITMPAPHHSVFYRPDALPAAQPTASKHWRQIASVWTKINKQHVDKSVHKYDIQNTSRLKICLKYIKSNTHMHMHTHTHTYLTALFPGLPRRASTRQNQCKTNLDFTEAKDSEWQWHLLGHMHLAPDR